ncbi:MAG TPA: anti-sigma factor [Roseiflexaceae bacterium]|nr:anti-sigma factor [Roseiflexaceae bacterium]HMP41300.1 anti-sigma factor [Roseiflexaceae bacterium]
MTHNYPDTHPTESIPAFVLGALDNDEAIRVAIHVASCAQCRSEADAFAKTVSLMPYAAGDLAGLRPEVKNRLFSRIALAHEESPADDQPAPPAARPKRVLRHSFFLPTLSAVLAVLVVFLGFLSAGMYHRRADLIAELDARDQTVAALQRQLAERERALADQIQLVADRERQLAATNRLLQQNETIAVRIAEQDRELATLRTQIAETEIMVSFLAAPATVLQPLVATSRAAEASAHMYMQPGHNQVVLLTHGLPQLQPGRHYRIWLTSEGEQVTVGALHVRPDGVAELVAQAPRPMDAYEQVLVTIEADASFSVPGSDVIFSVRL